MQGKAPDSCFSLYIFILHPIPRVLLTGLESTEDTANYGLRVIFFCGISFSKIPFRHYPRALFTLEFQLFFFYLLKPVYVFFAVFNLNLIRDLDAGDAVVTLPPRPQEAPPEPKDPHTAH